MEIILLVLKVLFLGGLPVAFFFGIQKATHHWPVAFHTFVGATICAINFRVAGTLADLDPDRPPLLGLPAGDGYRAIAWVVCPFLLLLGVRKLLRIRRAQALAELHQEP